MLGKVITIDGKSYKSEKESKTMSCCEGCAFFDDYKKCSNAVNQVSCEDEDIIWKEVPPVDFKDFNGQPFVSSSVSNALNALNVSNFITNDLTKAPSFPGPGQEIRVHNDKGGVKADGGKVRPTLLLRSMPDAVAAVIRILEKGAKKYDDNNWKLVEPERYDDAHLRHILKYLAGETLDDETKESHLAHAITCLLFRLQLDYNNDKDLTLPRK